MTEIKKKGRPSRENNILTKNAFEKKEEPIVPIVEEKKEAEVKEVPLTAPNTPIAPLVPIDMPKPKKERSAAQLEATKRLVEANKLKKGSKKEIIIKEEAIPEAKENLKVALKNIPVVKERSPTPIPAASSAAKGRSQERDLPVKKAPKEEKKKEKKVKKPVKYETSSEEESEESSEDKYIKKATRKIQVVNSIEERLRQNAIPRNKYSNLSIFS